LLVYYGLIATVFNKPAQIMVGPSKFEPYAPAHSVSEIIGTVTFIKAGADGPPE